ncbi:MAG: hypothetical protein HAW67_06960 [Endozoicomonadaceae bacterium]|nr:hypothetical protein [Endozoicomonadaceae bacterium]
MSNPQNVNIVKSIDYAGVHNDLKVEFLKAQEENLPGFKEKLWDFKPEKFDRKNEDEFKTNPRAQKQFDDNKKIDKQSIDQNMSVIAMVLSMVKGKKYKTDYLEKVHQNNEQARELMKTLEQDAKILEFCELKLETFKAEKGLSDEDIANMLDTPEGENVELKEIVNQYESAATASMSNVEKLDDFLTLNGPDMSATCLNQARTESVSRMEEIKKSIENVAESLKNGVSDFVDSIINAFGGRKAG